MNHKKILFISPHTDDAELACGATLNKLSQENEIYYAALSDCRETLRKTKFKNNALSMECRNALKILNVPKKNIHIFNHTNTEFCENKRKIYKSLEKLKKIINPNVVFIPHLNETHQDHKTTAEQALSVFRRDTTIISYEQPWNDIDFSPNYFVEVSIADFDAKIKALSCYKTQKFFKRRYFTEEYIRGIVLTRGLQIDRKYAEAYVVIKMIS